MFNLKKGLKSFLAVGAAVTMLLGTSLTALAADNTTTPRVVTEADANVIATSDATQLYITGSLTMVHDSYGSPNPQLVNNGDGSWVLIMYKGQTIALGVNNPYAAYTEYVPTITNTVPEPTDAEYEAGAEYIDPACSLNGHCVENVVYNAKYNVYGWEDAYNSVLISDMEEGSAVYNLTVNYYAGEVDAMDNGVPYSLSNTVTLAIYVLEAQAGAQAPTYTADEQYHQEHKTDAQIDWSVNTLIRVW